MTGLTYDNRKDGTIKGYKSEAEKAFGRSDDFPNCKGLYPDCPKIPDLTLSMCRTCPKTDNIKKPQIEQD